MKTWHETFPFTSDHPIIHTIFSESTLFFDIETTGFSPARSVLYMIGCASRKGNTLITDQFFAEDASEEKTLLLSFLTLLKKYDTVVTFNGLSFDVPYLKSKFAAYKICEPFSGCQHIDLYKEVSPLKYLLKLSDLKLKTLEMFLGINRKDPYTGGELIEMYKKYTKAPSPEVLAVLKQHNLEDVTGMPSLLPLLAYAKTLNGYYSVVFVEGNEYKDAESYLQKELFFHLKNDYAVPRQASCGSALFYITMDNEKTRIRVPLFEGELKYFFSEYKNYYYLPGKDTAIHKSIGSYIDRDNRVQATAANCYTKKYALFVPQQQEIITPSFRASYKDKLTYFELTENFLESGELLRRYTDHILKTLSGHPAASDLFKEK